MCRYTEPYNERTTVFIMPVIFSFQIISLSMPSSNQLSKTPIAINYDCYYRVVKKILRGSSIGKYGFVTFMIFEMYNFSMKWGNNSSGVKCLYLCLF